ncbi:hypothetical protein ACIBMZ_18170 [Micromonospora sp. NPDC049900]|uniref:hypothetical protein n=1 Tax=Micromonospora sp. NPDC049900 TaxID=3364275 RepID=UPI0037A5BC99
MPGRNRAVLRLVDSAPDDPSSPGAGREAYPARTYPWTAGTVGGLGSGSDVDGLRHPARSSALGPDGARHPGRLGAATGGDEAYRAAGGAGLSGRGGEVGRRRADGAFGDGLWPGAGLPAGAGQRVPSRGPWPDLGAGRAGDGDGRAGDGRDTSDPWPALPDDRALWVVPGPEDAAANHLRRLDREQAGG